MGFGLPLVHYEITCTQEGLLFELTRHHSIYDGFSANLLWGDFCFAYIHQTKHSTRHPYQEYVLYLQSLDSEASVKFWKDTLEGLQTEDFPARPSSGNVPKTSFAPHDGKQRSNGTMLSDSPFQPLQRQLGQSSFSPAADSLAQ
jgi:hypothetical protein